MEALGSKTAGRSLARGVDVPIVRTNEPIERPEEARALAQRMGYPVLLKAIAGGGGKGMRLVSSDEEFMSAFRDASSEAMNAFGNPSVFLEKYLEKPATSKFKFSPTRTAASFRSANANVPCSAATKK